MRTQHERKKRKFDNKTIKNCRDASGCMNERESESVCVCMYFDFNSNENGKKNEKQKLQKNGNELRDAQHFGCVQ